MKKTVLIPAALLIAVVIFAAARVSAADGSEKAYNLAASSTAEQQALYTVKLIDNTVTLLGSDGVTVLYSADDLPTDTLPDADIVRLREGVKIYSNEQLRKLLEDYDISALI